MAVSYVDITVPQSHGSRHRSDQRHTIPLSRLIDIVNERFRTEFKPGDRLFFDSIHEDALASEALRQSAKANTMENFGFVVRKALENRFIDRMDQSEETTARYVNDVKFGAVVFRLLLKEVYEGLRGAGMERRGRGS